MLQSIFLKPLAAFAGPIVLTALLFTTGPLTASDSQPLPGISVSEDGRGFVNRDSGSAFVPWGFNYDHDKQGRLLEDYWTDEWPAVEKAFHEMRDLGANVVRIHLQFGRFMKSADQPNADALQQLAKLLTLAEQTELYLDLTGLGCYHKQDVPEWYDRLSEHDRWQAQANFWSAVAKTCASSSAVFCYDLMNEPVVPGGDKPRTDWLGAGFGGKHFVQFITLDRKQRERSQIAVQWIRTLVPAIRQHDSETLITVGLVPWSLDRPGLTSGFVPTVIAPELDFIAVHIYPETNKLQEALATAKAFAEVGKPVVIEEIFPLKCNAADLKTFIQQSRPHVAGWIGFYWGTPPTELRPPSSIKDALTLSWLDLFAELAPEITESSVR